MLCQRCSAGNDLQMCIMAKKKPLFEVGFSPANTLASPSLPQGDGLSPSPSPPPAAVPLHLFNHLPSPQNINASKSCPPSQSPKWGAVEELAMLGHPSSWGCTSSMQHISGREKVPLPHAPSSETSAGAEELEPTE